MYNRKTRALMLCMHKTLSLKCHFLLAEHIDTRREEIYSHLTEEESSFQASFKLT